MRELMEELIVTIRETSNPAMFDYLVTIVPIFLSLVAIIISIYTAYKQNKITLFEKRYPVVNTVSFLASIAKKLFSERLTDNIILRHEADDYISANLPNRKTPGSNHEYGWFYRDLEFEVSKINYLFPESLAKPVTPFVEAFIKYAWKSLNDLDSDDEKGVLKERFDNLEKANVIEKMGKYLKL